MTYLFLFIRRWMFIFLFAPSLFLITQNSFATQWAKTYGGSAAETGGNLDLTSDGGYIVAGMTWSFGAGGWDAWITKFDQDGTVLWESSYGGLFYESASSIQQTSDGGYIVGGTFTWADQDMWVFKLDAGGAVTWQKRFGGINHDRVWDIQQTTDGGYIVAGIFDLLDDEDDFSGDMVILKLDSEGNLSWQKTYGGSEKDSAYSIQQTSDGGYVVAGFTRSFGAGDEDIWILKLDQDGTVTWQKTYGGEKQEYAREVQQTTDGGYIVCGYGYAGPGDTAGSFWVLKLASNGTITWQKTYGSESGAESAYTIQQTSDGGYIVGGFKAYPNATEMWILKLDHAGEIIWQNKYLGSSQYEYDFVDAVRQTSDGGYIIAGTVDRDAGLTVATGDMVILKLDSNGDINNCDSISDTTVTGDGTSIISVADSTAIISTPSLTVVDTTAEVHETTADVEELCFAADWFPSKSPSQNKLNGVWGYLSSTSNHEFYAVGEGGIIIHYNGTDWSASASYTPEDLHGVWGSSETDIFAVGDNATIVSYDGVSGWDIMDPPVDFTDTLNDVWGSSASDVYAVGEGGSIIHYDGVDWTEVTSSTPYDLHGIWGSSASDYVAVGAGGTIVRYSGSSWSANVSQTTEDLYEVWGSGSGNVYAVGKGGTIVHYDGSWNEIEGPTAANLRGIWGSSEDNIIVVGEYGTILHYNGENWSKIDSGSQDSLISTFGTLNPRVMIVGHDGSIFDSGLGPRVQGKICDSCTGAGIGGVQVEFDTKPPVSTNAYGIYPPFEDHAGPHMLSFTHVDYIPAGINLTFPVGKYLFDHATYLVPDTAGNYARCISGTVTRGVQIGVETFDRGVSNMGVKLSGGPSEPQITITDMGGNYHFTGLSDGMYSVEPVVVAGAECLPDRASYTDIAVPIGSASQYNFEFTCLPAPPVAGSYWEEVPSGTDRFLHGIWGWSGDNVFAVGDGGTIIHYDGNLQNTWSEQTSGTGSNLNNIWGHSADDVYAVGGDGTIVKTTNGGVSWGAMTSGTLNGLNAIWGSSASDIYAVGDESEIFHYDGNVSDLWTQVHTYDKDVKLLGIWGSSASDIYVVGNSHKDTYWERTVIHYDGIEWTELETGNGVTLMSTWGSGANDITATGAYGSIMRKEGTGWKQVGGSTEKTFNAMWGSSGSNIFAVGFDGVIGRYDGTRWTVRQPDNVNDQHTLKGIWGSSDTDIYAVGDNGKIYAYRGDDDGDEVADETDNCPGLPNGASDGTCTEGSVGNLCTIAGANESECGPGGYCSMDQEDTDGDGYGDPCDNCPIHANGADERTCRTGSEGIPCANDQDCGVEEEGICESTLCISGLVGSSCGNDDDCDVIGYCPPAQEDRWDGDGVGDACDNCLYTENEEQVNDDGDSYGDACDNCPDFTSEDQEDSYPPGGNNCGDACECEGNFNADEDNDVDGTDASTFKADFGRGGYNSPCIASDPCSGDFECDGDVDGSDASVFKADFGRGGYNNPCPTNCEVAGEWCTYP